MQHLDAGSESSSEDSSAGDPQEKFTAAEEVAAERVHEPGDAMADAEASGRDVVAEQEPVSTADVAHAVNPEADMGTAQQAADLPEQPQELSEQTAQESGVQHAQLPAAPSDADTMPEQLDETGLGIAAADTLLAASSDSSVPEGGDLEAAAMTDEASTGLDAVTDGSTVEQQQQHAHDEAPAGAALDVVGAGDGGDGMRSDAEAAADDELLVHDAGPDQALLTVQGEVNAASVTAATAGSDAQQQQASALPLTDAQFEQSSLDSSISDSQQHLSSVDDDAIVAAALAAAAAADAHEHSTLTELSEEGSSDDETRKQQQQQHHDISSTLEHEQQQQQRLVADSEAADTEPVDDATLAAPDVAVVTDDTSAVEQRQADCGAQLSSGNADSASHAVHTATADDDADSGDAAAATAAEQTEQLEQHSSGESALKSLNADAAANAEIVDVGSELVQEQAGSSSDAMPSSNSETEVVTTTTAAADEEVQDSSDQQSSSQQSSDVYRDDDAAAAAAATIEAIDTLDDSSQPTGEHVEQQQQQQQQHTAEQQQQQHDVEHSLSTDESRQTSQVEVPSTDTSEHTESEQPAVAVTDTAAPADAIDSTADASPHDTTQKAAVSAVDATDGAAVGDTGTTTANTDHADAEENTDQASSSSSALDSSAETHGDDQSDVATSAKSAVSDDDAGNAEVELDETLSEAAAAAVAKADAEAAAAAVITAVDTAKQAEAADIVPSDSRDEQVAEGDSVHSSDQQRVEQQHDDTAVAVEPDVDDGAVAETEDVQSASIDDDATADALSTDANAAAAATDDSLDAVAEASSSVGAEEAVAVVDDIVDGPPAGIDSTHVTTADEFVHAEQPQLTPVDTENTESGPTVAGALQPGSNSDNNADASEIDVTAEGEQQRADGADGDVLSEHDATDEQFTEQPESEREREHLSAVDVHGADDDAIAAAAEAAAAIGDIAVVAIEIAEYTTALPNSDTVHITNADSAAGTEQQLPELTEVTTATSTDTSADSSSETSTATDTTTAEPADTDEATATDKAAAEATKLNELPDESAEQRADREQAVAVVDEELAALEEYISLHQRKLVLLTQKRSQIVDRTRPADSVQAAAAAAAAGSEQSTGVQEAAAAAAAAAAHQCPGSTAPDTTASADSTDTTDSTDAAAGVSSGFALPGLPPLLTLQAQISVKPAAIDPSLTSIMTFRGASQRPLYITAVGHRDGTVHLYDATGAEIAVFDAGHSAVLAGLTLSTAPQPLLITAAADGSVHVHTLAVWASGRLIAGPRSCSAQHSVVGDEADATAAAGDVFFGLGTAEQAQRARELTALCTAPQRVTLSGLGVNVLLQAEQQLLDDTVSSSSKQHSAPQRVLLTSYATPPTATVIVAASDAPAVQPAVTLISYTVDGVTTAQVVAVAATTSAAAAVPVKALTDGLPVAVAVGADVHVLSRKHTTEGASGKAVCRGSSGDTVTAVAFDKLHTSHLYAGLSSGEVLVYEVKGPQKQQQQQQQLYGSGSVNSFGSSSSSSSSVTSDCVLVQRIPAAVSSTAGTSPVTDVVTVNGYMLTTAGGTLAVYNTTDLTGSSSSGSSSGGAELLYSVPVRRVTGSGDAPCGTVHVRAAAAASSSSVLLAVSSLCGVQLYSAALPYEPHSTSLAEFKLLGLVLAAMVALCTFYWGRSSSTSGKRRSGGSMSAAKRQFAQQQREHEHEQYHNQQQQQHRMYGGAIAHSVEPELYDDADLQPYQELTHTVRNPEIRLGRLGGDGLSGSECLMRPAVMHNSSSNGNGNDYNRRASDDNIDELRWS
jgi:hypothetical protein